MSFPEPPNLRPHDLAKAEIDAWRGRCLNRFSRAENAITQTLERMREGAPTILLEPLAGQRLKTLDRLTKERKATKAQHTALEAALLKWSESDVIRPFFSHGIATELTDRGGQWHVQLDFIAVRKGVSEPQRLNWNRDEALDFEKRLHDAFSALTRELGQFCQRLEPKKLTQTSAELKKPDPGSSPG